MLAACRILIYLAGWLVPLCARPLWRSGREANLSGWWTLYQRGELTSRSYPDILLDSWAAFPCAFWLRFSREGMRDLLHGPALVPAVGAAVLSLTAYLTHGIRYTRNLLEVFRTLDQPLPLAGRYDFRSDLIVAHALPLAFALLTATVLLITAHPSLPRQGWRSRFYLLAKLLLVLLSLPLLWIEGGAALRSAIPHEMARVLIGGLGTTALFVAGFGAAVLWCLDDQRHRCPSCLHLLALPVSLGSWASVFDPAGTEFLCESGHGALYTLEVESGEPDRWIAMDAA